ncbi:DUF1798 family protein, partial [Staphylococcus epidermidis]|uniref:DUF1798 family protein n=1 Tax=Staphylococcus epidermidis TaxID=1282 RepID=UPI003C7402F7
MSKIFIIILRHSKFYSKNITKKQYMSQKKIDLFILNIQKTSLKCQFSRTKTKLFV